MIKCILISFLLCITFSQMGKGNTNESQIQDIESSIIISTQGKKYFVYNPQNEMFSHFGTKRYNFKNETQLFKVIPHTSKNQKKSTGFAGTKYI